MHPELLNNSLFLRYYKQWQEDPSSILFVSIADYFLKFGMGDEAMRICEEGLKRHPQLVSARIVMAKIHMQRKGWEEAERELKAAIQAAPANRTAAALLEGVLARRKGEAQEEPHGPAIEAGAAAVPLPSSSWSTVTMARIYASQGHLGEARAICESILAADPGNEGAKKELGLIAQRRSDDDPQQGKDP